MNTNTSRDKRWLLLSLLVLSIFVAYLGRMSVSVALPFILSDMTWSIQEQGSLGGILLGIFLLSYGVSNIFFSPLIDIYGAKKMLVASILVWSCAVFMGAIWGQAYSIFLLSRIILGFGQGVLFPCATKFTAEWFPPGGKRKGKFALCQRRSDRCSRRTTAHDASNTPFGLGKLILHGWDAGRVSGSSGHYLCTEG